MIIQGVDVSKWQGDIDWNVAKGNGIEFAMIKLSEGNLVADSKAKQNATACIRLGIRCGFYHYFRPSVEALDQFNWILRLLHEAGDLPTSLPLALDVEQTDGRNPDEITKTLSALSMKLHDSFGYYPMLYTRYSFWDSFIRDWSKWKEHPLWVAHWTGAPDPLMPSDWEKWFIWQYKVHTPGSDYGAQSAGIDLDRMVVEGTPEPEPVDSVRATVRVEINSVVYEGTATLEKV